MEFDKIHVRHLMLFCRIWKNVAEATEEIRYVMEKNPWGRVLAGSGCQDLKIVILIWTT